MASEEERAKILAEYHAAAAAGGGEEDEWEDDDGADFDPSRYDSDEGSDEEEEEEEGPSDYAVLTGSIHLNEEGRVIYNGTWCLRSELDKEEAAKASLGGLVQKKKRHPKFKLKSQETLRPPPTSNGDEQPGRDVFDLRRPTLAKLPSGDKPEELPTRRTMMFDGFFFEPPPPGSEAMPPPPTGEGGRKHHHNHPVGKKVKERDVELFFIAGGDDSEAGSEGKEGDGKSEGTYRVMGRGHNDYGPFVLEGTYAPPPPETKAATVSGDEKHGENGTAGPVKPKDKGPVAKVVCNKTYGASAPAKATRGGAAARRGKRRQEDDDSFDEDFDEKADHDEVNELCEDAGLSVEELRRKYYGGGGGEEEEEKGDGGGKMSAAKRARLMESDDDDCGF